MVGTIYNNNKEECCPRRRLLHGKSYNRFLTPGCLQCPDTKAIVDDDVAWTRTAAIDANNYNADNSAVMKEGNGPAYGTGR